LANPGDLNWYKVIGFGSNSGLAVHNLGHQNKNIFSNLELTFQVKKGASTPRLPMDYYRKAKIPCN